MTRVLPGYSQAVEALTPLLCDLPARVVAIDGRDGTGKTTLGRYLAWHFNISLIETDLFLARGCGDLLYRDDELLRVIRARLAKNRPVIIEGVALLALLRRLDLSADFLIYVRNSEQPGSAGLNAVLTDYERIFVPEVKANIMVNINHDS